jgi:hypothetical protein
MAASLAFTAPAMTREENQEEVETLTEQRLGECSLLANIPPWGSRLSLGIVPHVDHERKPLAAS